MQAHGKTWMAKKEKSYDRDWYTIDADNQIVGRLATQIAMVLMGKHKPEYTPHVDTGDCVVVTSVERVRFTGRVMQHAKVPYMSSKLAAKHYDRYSGYPSGLKVRSGVQVMERRPERILSEAVRRMLPKNKLGRQMLKKLKLVVGTEHGFQAQKPQPFPAHLMPVTKDK
jgi:large subunit ribosomal protein L13